MELTVRDVVYVGSVLLGAGVTIGYIRAIVADLKEEVMLLRNGVRYSDTCDRIHNGVDTQFRDDHRRLTRLETLQNGNLKP